MKINCTIVDDEPLARKGISNFISEISFLNLTGEYPNPIEALPEIRNGNTDLLFLDIQMPKMNGVELLKTLTNPPLTIITTAFPNYAIESFELNVLDYLIKPIPFERFVKSVNKANDYLKLYKKAIDGNKEIENYFFIKCESRFEKIKYEDLLYVEALQNYVVLHTVKNKYISYLTFKSVEEYLPSDQFLKVQKSFIVSLNHIDSIEGGDIKIKDKEISISRSNKEEILEIILKNKFLKR